MTKAPHNIYRDDKVHVLSEKCATCIFKPKDRPVSGARVAEMVASTKDTEAATIVCHSTLGGRGKAKQNAICRGWYDRFAYDDLTLRIAMSMGIIEEVPCPSK